MPDAVSSTLRAEPQDGACMNVKIRCGHTCRRRLTGGTETTEMSTQPKNLSVEMQLKYPFMTRVIFYDVSNYGFERENALKRRFL